MAAILKRYLLNAPPIRAIVEVLLVDALLTLFSLAVFGLDSGTLFSTVFLMFINPVCALYYALRMQVPRGGWLRQGISEFLLLAVICCFQYILIIYGIMPLMTPDWLDVFTAVAATLIFAVILAFPFVFFRTSVRLLKWWQRMGRRRLIWSLVNSHLMALALLQSAVALPLILLFVLSNDNIRFTAAPPTNSITHFAQRVLVGLPLLGLAILGATAVLIALLPASALASYFFARRIRRRLDALIEAARTAGRGDYSTRVAVTGEDEVAQLQTDFNSMTVNLETTVRDLNGERETVQALLKSRREMMASVSHELRTPIATIRAYLDSAPRPDGNLKMTAADAVIVERELDRLQTLIDDLFTLSRAEVDQLAIRIAPLDAAALIRNVVAAVAPSAWRVNRIEVMAEAPPWIPLVMGDAARLEQSLRNLLHNSLRHTPPGGLIIVSVRLAADRALIQVRDTGEGIAADDLPHIWERYYRGRINGGSGLGLTLVKTFTEAMGGTVSVESAAGEGASFTLSLPLAYENTDSLRLPQPVPR